MCENLFELIEYINDNIRFGSNLENEKVEELFHNYQLSENEKETAYKELESLEIKVINKIRVSKYKLNGPVMTMDKNEEVIISNIKEEDKKDETESENNIDTDDLNFLDELDFDELDSILDDDIFNEELSKFKNVVDKSHNLEYLVEFRNNKDNQVRREQALDNLVNANRKLVWKITLRYQHFSTVSFDVDDMYQAGMQGLMKAADKFDTNKEYQFSTYATWWIRQSIIRNIADYSTTIRIPVHMREKIIKCIKVKNEFWKDNKRAASDKEMAELLNISLDEIKKLQSYENIANLTSLDMSIGEDGGSFIGEFITDEKHQTPEEYVEEVVLKQAIKEIFEKKLTAKEARILELRFGLTDNRAHTLEEIGKKEKVTRERIRQIESKAIKKLQKSINSERLKDFYYD